MKTKRQSKKSSATTAKQQTLYRLSLRVSSNSVTSISLNIKLVSLWLLVLLISQETTETTDHTESLKDTKNDTKNNTKNDKSLLDQFTNQNSLKKFISDFAYKQLNKWEQEQKNENNEKYGKGLSEFISSCIYFDICKHLQIDQKETIQFFDSINSLLQ